MINVGLEILIQCDTNIDLKLYKIFHMKSMFVSDYISWTRDTIQYLEDFLMEECSTEDIDSVQHKV